LNLIDENDREKMESGVKLKLCFLRWIFLIEKVPNFDQFATYFGRELRFPFF